MENGQKMCFIDILRVFDPIIVVKMGQIRGNMRFFAFFMENVDSNDFISFQI